MNASAQTITVYAAGSNGDVSPIQTLKGAKTHMTQPVAIAVR